MTPEQQQQYLDTLKAGKFDPDKRAEQYVFQRGWNAAIQFAEDHFNLITKPKDAP